MALQIARNSQGWPMQSLKPAGLPPDSRRISPMKAIISSGVENARCDAGEMQSSPIETPRIFEISSDTLAAGSTPPWPGLAPWLILSSTILIWSADATRADSAGLKVPWEKPPFLAPAFNARTALGLSAPKLIAEMLKTEAEYGRAQSGPPIVMRNFSFACAFGATE